MSATWIENLFGHSSRLHRPDRWLLLRLRFHFDIYLAFIGRTDVCYLD